MIAFIIVYGLFLIGVGSLVERYPNMISGYNTMSKAKKANVDIKSIAKLLRAYLTLAGVVTIVSSLLMVVLHLSTYIVYALVVPLFVSLIICSVRVQRYDSNKRGAIARYSTTIFMGVVAIFVCALFMRSASPVSFEIDENSFVVEGSYGVSVPFEQIESVELLDSLPKIAARVAGSSIGGEMRGNFRFKDKEFGTCRIFISGRTKPYLYIKRVEGRDIILNSPDSLVVPKLYDSLRVKCVQH